MRLAEIALVGKMRDYTEVELVGLREKILAGAESEYPLEKGDYRLVVSSTGHHALFNDKQLVGWLKLDPVTVGDRQVLAVVSTYVIPERRGTRDVPLLLMAVKQCTRPTPILVDGTLFKDGLALLNALVKRGVVKATVINIDTNQEQPYDIDQVLGDADMVLLEKAPALWVDMSIVDDIPHIQTLPLLEEDGVWVKSFHFITSQPATR